MARSSIRAAARRTFSPFIFWLLALLAGSSSILAADCAVERRSGAQARHTFLGYVCREPECAAHKAGFAWADRHGITDSAACADADDAAFGEGCRVFADLAVTAEQSGFEWARANALPDDCSCDGAGPRFAAGCEAFVRAFGR